VENAGGVWKETGHLISMEKNKTVIFQFEFDHKKENPRVPDIRLKIETQFVIDTCIESVRDYADKHGYDYCLITDPHPNSPDDKPYYDRDFTSEWLYWLGDLSEKYDDIIVVDTDVYVVNDEHPFPLDNTGYFCYALNMSADNHFLNGKSLKKIQESLGQSKIMFTNSGVVKLDKKTAKKINDWFILNRDDNYEMVTSHEIHYSDQVHILKYLIENPEDFNPTMPRPFNYIPDTEIKKDPEAYFYHLTDPQDTPLYEMLCTVLKKYT